MAPISLIFLPFLLPIFSGAMTTKMVEQPIVNNKNNNSKSNSNNYSGNSSIPTDQLSKSAFRTNFRDGEKEFFDICDYEFSTPPSKERLRLGIQVIT